MVTRTTGGARSFEASRRRGVLHALGAAVMFGLSTPLIQKASSGLGVFTAGALIYLGAALLFGLSTVWSPARRRGEVPLGPRRLPLLVVVTVLGAVLAPAMLVWGLSRASALSASLLLNMEGAFTVVLAWLLNGERAGARVAVSAVLVTVGSTLVVAGAAGAGIAIVGLAAVGAATLGWAIDSTLSARLSDIDPRSVVTGKGALGTVLSLSIAIATGEGYPPFGPTVALIAVGSIGYGLSLALYLHAQRSLGAARAAALFAAGPFVGAVSAFAMGDRPPTTLLLPATVLLVLGVWLQSSERHGHRHRHEPIDHEHVHTHEDGHHEHPHDRLPEGPHSHLHSHEEREHDHPHLDDAHHRHRH